MKDVDVIEWYDLLATEDDDPVYDGPFLREYMDKWDGKPFIDSMKIRKHLSYILEIGVGTGRIARRVAPEVCEFIGIDISPKTIERAAFNLGDRGSAKLICMDFLDFESRRLFNIIYSTLTFMHIKDKQKAFNKVYELLDYNGRFVLSIDKNLNEYITNGTYRVKVYPDYPDKTRAYILESGLIILDVIETEFAYIFVCTKEKKQ